MKGSCSKKPGMNIATLLAKPFQHDYHFNPSLAANSKKEKLQHHQIITCNPQPEGKKITDFAKSY